MQETATKKEVKQTKKTDFTKGSLSKSMLKFACIYMLGILLQNLYGAVDLIVVGQFASAADISAVTVGSQLMNIVTQLVIGFASGLTVLIGNAFGAKDEDGLSKTTGTAIVFFLIVAAILTALYFAFNNILISIMNTPEDAVVAAREYVFICSFGILFIAGYNVISGILTGLGDSKTPFIFIAVACVINIVLDIVFVKGFGMGAAGAAIATVAAQLGSFIFSLLFLLKKGLGYPLKKSHLRLSGDKFKNLLVVGLPVAVQNVLIAVSFLFITAIINTMGLNESAAVGVVEKLINFLFVPALAMSTTVAAASSQNLGAGLNARADKSLLLGIAFALVPSVIICIFCQFGGNLLAAIFTPDLDIIALANNYLRSYIFDVIAVSAVFCFNGYFNSKDKSWFSLTHSVVTTFVVRVPLAYLFSTLENSSLFLIGWAAPLSTLVSLVLCIIFLIFNKKHDAHKRSAKL